MTTKWSDARAFHHRQGGHTPGRSNTEGVRGVALADPDLPRSNGELSFDEPWQGRALAMAIVLVEQLGLDWDAFREQLIAAIAADPERPYWDSWAAALDSFVVAYLPDGC